MAKNSEKHKVFECSAQQCIITSGGWLTDLLINGRNLACGQWIITFRPCTKCLYSICGILKRSSERPNNPEYERPAVVTLLRGLYLWNRKSDWQAVFFGGYPHPFYRAWDQCWIMPVPTVARGACYLGECHKCSACCFSITAGPIALKFGMQLGSGDPLVTAYAVVTGGVFPHRASVSRKRLGRLCSNLVCELRVIN